MIETCFRPVVSAVRRADDAGIASGIDGCRRCGVNDNGVKVAAKRCGGVDHRGPRVTAIGRTQYPAQHR
ncbi:MAG TPA: hypothetical protein VII15_00825, partial [Candidatus Cryosericum sp.]